MGIGGLVGCFKILNVKPHQLTHDFEDIEKKVMTDKTRNLYLNPEQNGVVCLFYLTVQKCKNGFIRYKPLKGINLGKPNY